VVAVVGVTVSSSSLVSSWALFVSFRDLRSSFKFNPLDEQDLDAKGISVPTEGLSFSSFTFLEDGL